MSTQTQLIVNNIEIQSPKCGWWSCDNTADYKTLSGTIDGKKSESWGKLDYGYSKHLYHWNLCGEEEDKQCADCEIEAKKHCDECGGYGSCSDDDEEEEEYKCEQCSVEVKTEKDLTITYGCMDMKFCEDCYKTSKDCVKEEDE